MNRKIHLRLEITYDYKDPDKSKIKTNLKKEIVESFLDDWLLGQVGEGIDDSKANERDVYNIVIGLDLSDDTFYTSGDTGNKSLTAGIIMAVSTKLDKIEILPLN